MILPIIYINYLIFFEDFSWFFLISSFFLCFISIIYLYIRYSKKINPWKIPHISYEMKYTTFSFLIFFTITFWYFYTYKSGFINFIFDINIFTILYAVVFVILHDAYFYILHRFLHTPFMMKYVHRVHHISHPTNVWSSYSFHPIEALLYAFVTVILFFIDVHFYALLFAIFYNDLFTILGHSGYEFFGKKYRLSLFYKYFATPSYHDVHHSRGNGNIGLYFTYLDNIFHTRSKDTEKVFDNI